MSIMYKYIQLQYILHFVEHFDAAVSWNLKSNNYINNYNYNYNDKKEFLMNELTGERFAQFSSSHVVLKWAVTKYEFNLLLGGRRNGVLSNGHLHQGKSHAPNVTLDRILDSLESLGLKDEMIDKCRQESSHKQTNHNLTDMGFSRTNKLGNESYRHTRALRW